MTTEELAELAGVGIPAIQRLIRLGRIEPEGGGRGGQPYVIAQAEAERWLSTLDHLPADSIVNPNP